MGIRHCTAIVLAGGQGKRMGTNVHKQYLEISGKPLIYYSLMAFETSAVIDDVILVVGEGYVDYVRTGIVENYGFRKVRQIITGGKERYDSVWEGLKALKTDAGENLYTERYVFIHDGARPFVDEEILVRAYDGVCKYRACVVGMPSKDTVKLADEKGFAIATPDRRFVWNIQTPQVFEMNLIKEAYSRLMGKDYIQVTDDAMAVEQEMRVPVKLVEGSYKNIKITTPEDLAVAEVFLNEYKKK